MQLRFSDGQAEWISAVWDPWIQNYLKARYGRGWYWYWMNWQHNHELLF